MIAITGHTSGIGLAIAQRFADQGVVGYSRSNGYDLANPATIDRIVNAAANADIFVNNAFHQFAQVELLYALYDRWKANAGKTILTISSNSADGHKSYRHPYAVCKAALDKAVAQLQNTYPACHILNLRPGYVVTPRVSHITAPKLEPSYVAEVAAWMLAQPGEIITLTVIPRGYA